MFAYNFSTLLLDNQVSNLLRSLVTHKIQTKLALLQRLKVEPTFLLDEIKEFVSVNVRKDFQRSWVKLSQ